MMWRAHFLARSDGSPGCRLRVSPSERQVLRTLPEQLTDVLRDLEPAGSVPSAGTLPPALKRLFPPAYTQDDEAQAGFAAATHEELLGSHLESLRVVTESVTARQLTAEEMEHWLAALNDLRLVLGTVVGVTEEQPDDVRTMGTQERLYHFLGGLQEELLGFLSERLPPPTPGADDTVPADPWGDPVGGLRWDGTTQPSWPERGE
ncbi:MAG TPA: DUF2017 family protein [Acidimicrobiales bacterium]|nr:DUF2017 family protein [Acidimicrobiales bacterium]